MEVVIVAFASEWSLPFSSQFLPAACTRHLRAARAPERESGLESLAFAAEVSTVDLVRELLMPALVRLIRLTILSPLITLSTRRCLSRSLTSFFRPSILSLLRLSLHPLHILLSCLLLPLPLLLLPLLPYRFRPEEVLLPLPPLLFLPLPLLISHPSPPRPFRGSGLVRRSFLLSFNPKFHTIDLAQQSLNFLLLLHHLTLLDPPACTPLQPLHLPQRLLLLGLLRRLAIDGSGQVGPPAVPRFFLSVIFGIQLLRLSDRGFQFA